MENVENVKRGDQKKPCVWTYNELIRTMLTKSPIKQPVLTVDISKVTGHNLPKFWDLYRNKTNKLNLNSCKDTPKYNHARVFEQLV